MDDLTGVEIGAVNVIEHGHFITLRELYSLRLAQLYSPDLSPALYLRSQFRDTCCYRLLRQPDGMRGAQVAISPATIII
ncbi:hypothetical protein D3C76_1697440 [compost metagenome]